MGPARRFFCVVTADGAILQEDTLKGLDGLAPAGTIKPLLRPRWEFEGKHAEPRLGVIMNPHVDTPNIVLQLFVSEPFNNTIAAIDLMVAGPSGNEVLALGDIRRIGSRALSLPVDLAPAQIETEDIRWASNTTLEEDSDFMSPIAATTRSSACVRTARCWRSAGSTSTIPRWKMGSRLRRMARKSTRH
jgi:hypothetical protein